MDDENPPPNRPYRMRRPSSSLISSTTSPMFSAPPTPTLQPPPSPMAHHSRHRPNNNTNSNNGAISQQNNNFGPGDIDDDVQPSSSSSPFPPPSPRPARMGGSSSASFSRNAAQSIQGPQSPLSSPDSTFWGGAAPSPSPATPYRGGPSTPGGMCVVSSSTIDDVPPSPFSPAEDISNHSTGGGHNNNNQGGGGGGSLNSASNLLNNPLIAGPVPGPSHHHSNNVNLNSANNSGGNIVANNNGSLLVHNRISQLIVASGSSSGGSASSSNHQQHPALISQLNQESSIENNHSSQSHQNVAGGSSAGASSSSSSSSSSSFAFSSSMSPLRNKIKKASSFERFSQQAQAASSGSGGAGSSTSSSSSSRATGGSGSAASPAIVQSDNSIPTGLSSHGGSSNEIINNNENHEPGGGSNNEQPISVPLAAPPSSQSAIVSRLNSTNWEPVATNSGSTSSSASSSSFRFSQSMNFGSDKPHIKIPSKKLAAKIASVFEQEQLNEAAAMAAAAASASGANVINIPSTSSASASSSASSGGDNLLHHHHQQQPSVVQSYLNNSSTSSPPQSQNSSSNNANSTLSQILNEGPVHHLTGMGSLVTAAEEQIMSHHNHHPHQGIHSSVAASNHENLIRELSESPLNLAESSSNNSSSGNNTTPNSNSHHHTSHLHHHSQSQSILPQRNPVISSSRASSSTTTSNHNNSTISMAPTASSSSSSSTATLLSKKIPLTPKQKLLHRIQSGIISPPPPSQPTPPQQQPQQQQHQQHHVSMSMEHQMQEPSPSPPHHQQQQTVQQLSQQLQQSSISAALSSMQSSSGSLQSGSLSLEQLNSMSGVGGGSGNNGNHLILPHSPNGQMDVYSYEALMTERENLVVQEALGKIIEDPSNVNNTPYDTPEAYAYYQSILSDDEIFTGSSQHQSNSSMSSRSTIQQQIQGSLQVSNDALQQQQQQQAQQQQHQGGQIEFVLGLPDHDRNSARADDLSLGGDGGMGQQQQFLDPNDTLVTIKSHSQTDSTLRNLLMMDASRGHVNMSEEAWLLAEYQNRILPTDFNRSSSATTTASLRNGMMGSGANTGLNSSSVLTINGLPTSIGGTSWSNDASWQRTSIAWQHQGGMVDQDEVMDMSMIEPDKTNSGSGGGQNNSMVFSKRMSQLHTYGDQGAGMDDVNLGSDRDLANGLPLLQNMPNISMPMDLQQPLGILQSTSTIANLKNALINSANGLPIDLQQHHKLLSAANSNMDMDDQPVNLMAVNLEQELSHHSNASAHHHQQQQQQQHSAAHLLPHHLAEVKSLSHSNSGGNSSNDHSDDQNGGSYTLQIHQQQQHMPHEFHHSQQQQHLVEVNNLSPVLDNIDERRIIRVKKNKDNIPFSQEDSGNGLAQPNFIPDKPVQLKSHASLPAPLQLIQFGNCDDEWAVFTRNKSIPPNTRFGPVEGSLKKACAADMDTMNAVYPSLIVTDHHNNVLWKVNREDDDCCNWMKFVRMAHSIKDQNALVSEGEIDGHLYFTSCKEIPPRTELQVGFSFEYAQKYGLPYLLPLPNANSPNNNQNNTVAPSPPSSPPSGMMNEEDKLSISSFQQQNAMSGTSSVIHAQQNYLQQQQQQQLLHKNMNEENDPVIVQNHQHASNSSGGHDHSHHDHEHSHPPQPSSVSPETTSSVLSHQAPPPPPPQPQQKSVIVESYQCFECEQEFSDVAQLQDHLEKMHKEPEPEIRRPKKKAIKKYQQQQLQQQNSAVSTTNNGNNSSSSGEVIGVSLSFDGNNPSNQQQQSGKVDSSSQINAVDSSDPLSLGNLPMTKKRKAASSMHAMKALSASSSSSIITETQSISATEHGMISESTNNSTLSSVLQNNIQSKAESVVSSGGSEVNKPGSGSDKDDANNCPEIDSLAEADDSTGGQQQMQVDGNVGGGGNDNDVTASQPPAKVKCTMCYKSFATKERLDKHMIVHSDEDTKPLKCIYCPKRFLTNSALAGHIKTHAEEGKCFECPICIFSTQQLLQLKEHVQTHKSRDSGMFHCPQCPKKFSAYSMIRKHIRAFHGPRQYECEQCPMSFPTSDKLKLHRLKHSDHREFLCAECGRQFKRKDKLREHTKRIHETKRKAIELTLPKDKSIKKFLPKISPEEYERFVYKCSECMVGFKRRGMLVNHLAKRHPEKPPQQVPELNMPIVRPARNYFCLYCERVYKSSSKRKAHIIKSHPGKPIPPQARCKDIPEQLASFIDPQPLQPGTIVQTLTDDGNNTARAGVVTSSRVGGGVVSTSTLAAARRETVVGKVVAQPHGCQWCHRQYATRAKLLQHQRKSHISLMPPDMQTPRTQKNNVAKKEERPKSKSTSVVIKLEEQDSVISSNVPSFKTEPVSKSSSKISLSSSTPSSNNTVSTTSVVVSAQSSSANNNSITSSPGGSSVTTLQALQAEGLPFQTEEGGLVGILVTNMGSNMELGNLVQGDVPIVMLTTQSVGGNTATATQAALSALQGVNFSVLQAGQVTNHGTNASPNNIIAISSANTSTTNNNVESNTGNSSSSPSSSNNNGSSSSSTVTSRIANVIQHHQSSSGVISTTGKL